MVFINLGHKRSTERLQQFFYMGHRPGETHIGKFINPFQASLTRFSSDHGINNVLADSLQLPPRNGREHVFLDSVQLAEGIHSTKHLNSQKLRDDRLRSLEQQPAFRGGLRLQPELDVGYALLRICAHMAVKATRLARA